MSEEKSAPSDKISADPAAVGQRSNGKQPSNAVPVADLSLLGLRRTPTEKQQEIIDGLISDAMGKLGWTKPSPKAPFEADPTTPGRFIGATPTVREETLETNPLAPLLQERLRMIGVRLMEAEYYFSIGDMASCFSRLDSAFDILPRTVRERIPKTPSAIAEGMISNLTTYPFERFNIVDRFGRTVTTARVMRSTRWGWEGGNPRDPFDMGDDVLSTGSIEEAYEERELAIRTNVKNDFVRFVVDEEERQGFDLPTERRADITKAPKGPEDYNGGSDGSY